MIKCVKSCFCEYSTPQILVVKSCTIGTLYRLYQMLAIPLILCFVLLCGDHQDTDDILSSVTTKVKGIALTNTPELGEQIWDVADYIIPSQDDSSFFLMTNMIFTPNQTQSKCAEYPTLNSICTSDMNCTKGFKDAQGNGVQTGRCVDFSDSVKTCEVLAWCPVEKKVEPPNPALLADAENFTIYIKNNIQFTKFNFKKRNILPNMSRSYVANCVFNRNMDPDCPIFRIKDIFEETREDFQTMAVYGGIMAVQIQWDCDLDMDTCAPQYSFRRIDKKDPKSSETPVHNLRFAKYYKNSHGKDTRTLIKGYGIRFDVLVYGKAKKICIFTTIINVGALLSYVRVISNEAPIPMAETHYGTW
ncbi:P2X purinoceptor 4a-like isoform X2 [Siphateles boraxobius]|uniref:P2X purinoceptor 4a-like isoform X2 n=1 Tax=Siphateles boraxobius TaxID=180520 RepID=UPI0040632619